jgi:SAM-dependent methyltransferase
MVLRGCPVCAARHWKFEPLPDTYSSQWRANGFPYAADDFETLNVRAYACPSCQASDRDRMCAIWITRRGALGGSLLDVGPSRPLQSFLRTRFEYRSLDSEAEADVRGNVQELPNQDESFDALICSHVLEHVADDRLALRELRRVLRSDGWGIIMVPICLAAPRIDEDDAVDEATAWKRFGQGDHVRLYDRAGFLERVIEAGFRVDQWRPRLLDRLRYGLGRGSVLYVVSPST